jgi:DNA-directed RNA polymerase specialized sigma24 family protein
MDSAISRFPKLFTQDDREDLKQELWAVYLDWDHSGEIRQIFERVVNGYATTLKRGNRRRFLDAPGEQDRIGELNPTYMNDPSAVVDVAKALDSLLPVERLIVEMFMQGMTERDTAKEFGRSKRWVRYMRRRAFNKIKEELGEDYECQSK